MQTSPSALKILPIRASVRTREQRADQQYHDADANRSIGKIEDQKWAPFAEMQVQEIDHEAKADAIEDIAKRAAKHTSKRQCIAHRQLEPHPSPDDQGDRGGKGYQQPKIASA